MKKKFKYKWFPIILLSLLILLMACSRRGREAVLTTKTEIPATAVFPLETPADLEILLEDIGDSRLVLLGEATHGTSEFYSWRATLTKRLIEEKGFDLIAVEGDWSDAQALNNYIRNKTSFSSAEQALEHFDRWPEWMWKNEETAALAEWLASYNSSLEAEKKVGFYGLDLYGLRESLQAVHLYLQEFNPSAATTSGAVIKCLEPYVEDDSNYARVGVLSLEDCADEVSELYEVVEETVNSLHAGSESGFSALQHAIVVSNAEAYYRTAGRSFAASWNVRDLHMTGTIERLLQEEGSKIIVWAHNSHVGDARATPMEDAGIVNIGQLLREQRNSDEVYIVGFGTYSGKVIAAEEWGKAPEVMKIPAARRKSWEGILHRQVPEDMIILMTPLRKLPFFREPIDHRAIGVVYDPHEAGGGYVPSVMPERYNAFIFLDRTEALKSLQGN